MFAVTVLCKRLKMSNISFLTALFSASLEVSTFHYSAKTTNNGTSGSFSNRTPTSMILLHTTYTCGFKPGCLMSHNWLHTPDSKVLNEMISMVRAESFLHQIVFEKSMIMSRMITSSAVVKAPGVVA